MNHSATAVVRSLFIFIFIYWTSTPRVRMPLTGSLTFTTCEQQVNMHAIVKIAYQKLFNRNVKIKHSECSSNFDTSYNYFEVISTQL